MWRSKRRANDSFVAVAPAVPVPGRIPAGLRVRTSSSATTTAYKVQVRVLNRAGSAGDGDHDVAGSTTRPFAFNRTLSRNPPRIVGNPSSRGGVRGRWSCTFAQPTA